nr:immunoglobulin light chain junction region [Macaca mulatta]
AYYCLIWHNNDYWIF